MPNLVGIGLSQVPTNSMLGGLAYQSPDHASIKDLDLKNLSQINSEIADTAVDIFIYDTSKDSDGGAWRKRTTHTSWYNETLGTATRGTRREFPAVAVIVAETDTLTIYDGDDPDLPMWMVFEVNTDSQDIFINDSSSTLTSIAALNGRIFAGSTRTSTTGNITGIDFVGDRGGMVYTSSSDLRIYNGGIGQRNDGLGNSYGSSNWFANGPIVNRNVNDVAMTVLPNAPIDSATGLPVPTIAVATAAGVSVIKDDGTVVDIQYTWTTVASYSVDFTDDGQIQLLMYNTDAGGGTGLLVGNIPSSDTSTSSNFSPDVFREYRNNGDLPVGRSGHSWNNSLSKLGTERVLAYSGATTTTAIAIIDENLQSPSNGMHCGITTSFNTGWMHGNIKGAFLSDTDATNLSGYLYDDDMQNDDTSDWIDTFADTFAYVTSPVTAYQLTRSVGDARTRRNLSGTISAGTKIIVTYEAQASSGTPSIKYGMTNGSYDQSALTSVSINTNWNFISFEATFGTTGSSNHTYVTLWNSTPGATVYYRNFKVRVIEEDRSVNNNSLAYFGTITKSAVATGAELVSYGFSASSSNYLLQPYNSLLNFGTGDFSIMYWFYQNTSPSDYQDVVSRTTAPISDGSWTIQHFPSDQVTFYLRASGSWTSPVASNPNITHNGWNFIVVTRSGSSCKMYFDGREVGSFTSSNTLTNTSAQLKINTRLDNTSYEIENGNSVALVRVSGSAPSAEQIKKIYEDEKVLFQENAKATLYGSSDAVTALAYDEVTDRLHVGTSSGRSDFQGLRRINNTTTAVTTAISAHDEFIVEQ